jgi:hypothetical protein
MLLSDLHSSLIDLASLFPSSLALSAHASSSPSSSLMDLLLYRSPRVDFLRRWSALKHKLDSASHWLNLHLTDQAVVYSRPATRDARILAREVRREMARITTTLECGRGAMNRAELSSAEVVATEDAASIASLLRFIVHLSFLFIEVGSLVLFVLIFAWGIKNPTRVQPILARILPTAVAKKLGVNELGSRYKHH